MNGLDLLVLGRILSWEGRQWTGASIAKNLNVDGTQIHYSLRHLGELDLVAPKSKRLIYENIEQLLCCALKYVYPPKFTEGGFGIPTMYSAWPLKDLFNAHDTIVWKQKEDMEGVQGDRCLSPFHKRVPELCLYDRSLYAFCSLADAVRAGKPREIEEGKRLLMEMFVRKNVLH